MIVLKIVYTVLIVLMLLFFVSWGMMNFEGKREEFWFRTAQISGILLALIMVGSFLVLIWTDN